MKSKRKNKRGGPVTLAGRVVVAWAEDCSGPGWRNFPVFALIQSPDGAHAIRAIQPKDHTDEIRTLFGVSSLVSEQMRLAATRALNGKAVKR